MNHMKKMMPAVWGAAIAMTACGSSAGEPAQSSVTQADREELTAVWKAASEKTGALTSVALSTSMDLYVRSGKENFESSVNTEILLDEAGQEDMTCLWNTDASLNEELSVETVTFYTGGYYYLDLPDRRNPDCVSEISIKEESDSRIITFVGEPEQIEEYLRRSMEYSKSPMADWDMKVVKNQGEVMVNSQG